MCLWQDGYITRICECVVDCIWNVMAHAQKTDFVFRRNGRVHLNRQGRQLSTAGSRGVLISSSNAGYTKFRGSEGHWLPTPFVSFLFTSPPVHQHVPSHFNWTLTHRITRLTWMALGIWSLHSIALSVNILWLRAGMIMLSIILLYSQLDLTYLLQPQ